MTKVLKKIKINMGCKKEFLKNIYAQTKKQKRVAKSLVLHLKEIAYDNYYSLNVNVLVDYLEFLICPYIKFNDYI
tara:strand:- start:347 stop:571 length:225 start_codon:yes stop_codon:yes gene_type:complete